METCELCGTEEEYLSGCENCASMFCERCVSPINDDYCKNCTQAAEEAMEADCGDEE